VAAMVVPGVVGQVVVAFHDMHAGAGCACVHACARARMCACACVPVHASHAAPCTSISLDPPSAVKAMTRINGHVFGGRVVRGR